MPRPCVYPQIRSGSSASTRFHFVRQPNWGFNADTNSGHAFGIFMPAIGTLQPTGFRCRLTRR